jgi:ATP-dependent helicase/nuclease subunit A
VRKYFHLADVDPLFVIAGRGDQAVLRMQALTELMDECFNDASASFHQALEALTGFDEDELMRLILRVYDYSRASADPAGWLGRAAMAYEGGTFTRCILEGDLCGLPLRAYRAAQALLDAAGYVEANMGPGNPLAMPAALRSAADAFMTLFVMPYPPGVAKVIQSAAPPAASPRNARMDRQTFAPVEAAIARARELQKELKSNRTLTLGIDFAVKSTGTMALPAQTLVSLVNRFEALYRARKEERNLLDFADVEHLALRILRHEKVAAALMAQYECVFVDEYQDTNELQEAIITGLARPGALFLVGDVKQSIYAFRDAEPALFLRRYRASSSDGESAEDQSDVRLDLNTNFRSTRSIVGLVNLVFSRIMRTDHGGLDYDESQALSAGLPEDGDPVAVMLLLRGTAGDDEEDEIVREDIQRQAVACGARIRELVDRGYRFEDIAILVRELKNSGADFVMALAALDIPVSSSVGADVLKAQETGSMLALLRLVDNARDDLAMLGALKSPAALLSARDLAQIRAHDKQLPFALAAKAFAQNGAGPGADRLRAFFVKLEKYRSLCVRMRVDRLLSEIYADTNALAYYALMPGGARKVENLHALWQSAQTYAQLGDGSLFGFLQMLSQHSELGVSEMATAPGGSNAVRLMTVHGAKGLEFPAVILPFLNRPLGGGNREIPLTREQGVGLRLYDAATGSYQKSEVWRAIESRARARERDEHLRLLYVAMTRAQKNLTLVADGTESAYQRAASASPQDAKNVLGLVLPSLCGIAAGAALCRALSLEPAAQPEDCRVEIDLIDDEALVCLRDGQRAFAVPAFTATEDRDTAFVDARLEYAYPHREDARVPGKVVASMLHERAAMPFEPLAPPQLEKSASLTPAQIGTAVHKAMLKLRFGDACNVERIQTQIDRQAENGLLSEAERLVVDPRILLDFLSSDIGRRLCASGRVLREQPFVIGIPARAYDPLLQSTADTSLQGIIDCAFWDEDGWVLIDYKTNQLPKGGLGVLREEYQEQMDAYRFALEKLTGFRVKQCVLGLLMLREQLDIVPGELYLQLQRNASIDLS